MITENSKTNEKIRTFINDFTICEKPSCLRCPFKIVLKDFATWIKEQNEKKQSKTVLSFIKHRIEIIGDGIIEIDIIREFLCKVSTLFIFDGLDEVPVTSNRNDVLKEINDFIEIELKNQNADAVILCTTRQQGYTKEFDENTFNHFIVSELSDIDCINYLDRLLTNMETSYDDRQAYLKTLHDAIKDDVTGRLMRTPLQATIMTILVKSGGKPSRNKYNLFKEYYDTIYKRELQKELLPILKDHKRNIDDIHALLGFELQVKSEGSDNPSALFESHEFQSLIRMYLKEKEEWEEIDIESFIIKITNAVTDRLVFIGEIQDNKIGFIIRSLQEYFAANYIINFGDSIVIKNITDISSSSYWRNTFLFAVSGLHNTKNHLIDQVYLQCERLNGNEDDINIPSIYNTIFLGSWLALEILSEGIFSDSPKNRNRFVRLLEKLFIYCNTGDLSKIEYLPIDTVKELIILKYINETLLSDKSYIGKYASFKLAFALIKNNNFQPYVFEILAKSWNDDYEFELIELMHNSENSDSIFFMEKLYGAVLKDGYFKYVNFFKDDFNNECKITQKLVTHFGGDILFIGRILEISFLTMLDQIIEGEKYNIFDLYNEIIGSDCFSSDKEYVWSILDRDYKTERIEIVKGYSLSIFLINSDNYHLDYFSELFDKYSLTYLLSYIQFIKYPNNLNLLDLCNHLKDMGNNFIFNILFKSSKIWLFEEISSISSDIFQIDGLIQSIKNNEFGDYSDWLLSENRIIKELDYKLIFKYYRLSHRSSNTKAEILNSFHSKFFDELQNEEPNLFKIEFLKIFGWSFGERFNRISTFIPSAIVNETVLRILNYINIRSLNRSQLYTLRIALFTYLKNIDPGEIKRINSAIFDIFEISSYDEPNRNVRRIDVLVFENCINYYNSCLAIGKCSSIEKLILYLIYNNNDLGLDQVNLLQFKCSEIGSEESIYKIILKLISSKIDIRDIGLIVRIFNENTDSILIFEVVTKLFLNVKLTENWCIEFFIKMYVSIIMQNHPDISILKNIELYLKYANESKMTNMRIRQLSYPIK